MPYWMKNQNFLWFPQNLLGFGRVITHYEKSQESAFAGQNQRSML